MIQVDNITKNYGRTRALRGVSFTINRGEIVGFLGPNGAGKTTTMKILTCYMPADTGTASVAGFDIFEKPLEVRRRIGYLAEGAPLYHDMPVVDFLKFVGQMRNLPSGRLRQRIGEVIGMTGLQKAVGKNIGELSKGYRQRVGLAQALLHEPDILILDEPTSGLDPNQIKEIRDLIREIGREKTVILSTHILPEVTATCDRAIIISDGRVVASGTPQELMTRGTGQASVVVQVRGPKPDVESALAAISGVTGVEALEAVNGAARFRVNAGQGKDLPEQVFKAVVAKNWVLTELRPEGATLEDVFAELTK